MMRILLVYLITVTSAAAQAANVASPWGDARQVGEADGVFSYRFERGHLRYEDILTLANGSKRLGKAMEWANQVLLFEADGRAVVFDVGEVERFEFRRYERHNARPALADLTVGYVERLPRDPSWHGHVVKRDGLDVADVEIDQASWHPAVGSTVTFRVHVLNAGAAASSKVVCQVMIDESEVKTATVPPLEPGEEHVVEAGWSWQEGQHTLRVDVDRGGKARELVRWNNTFVEPIGALGVTVVVASDRYQAFKDVANIADSFCFEDWIQYQISAMNGLFAASVYASAPRGIEERVRCDRIVVVDNPMAPAQRERWEPDLHKDGKAEGVAEYAALWVLGQLSDEDVPVYDALRVDWAGLRRVAEDLGLIDLAATDTKIGQCLVLDQHGRYAQRRHLFPWQRTMMYTAGGFVFDERSVAFLNHVRGRPRGFRGDCLYQVPEKISVEARSNAGTPLSGVQVDMFQMMSEGEHAGMITGRGRGDPICSAKTGADGRLTLLNLPAPSHKTAGGYELRPNPFGKIATDGSNALLLLRLRQDGQEEFHFLRLFDCNVAYVRGTTKEYVHLLHTQFAAPDAPAAPPYAAVRIEDRTGEKPPMYIRWLMSPDTAPDSVEEFRVYRRTSFAGDDARPWMLMTTVGEQDGKLIPRADGAYFEDFWHDVPYSLDTFYAVSTVDRQGRESGLSVPGFLAYGKDSVKLAMNLEAAYITLTGEGPCQMIYWDGAVGMQPYGVRTQRFKDYVPALAGLAFGADGRMIATDPVNHVLAFYDRGELVELVPNRKRWPGYASDEPGEFYTPADVAVDDHGNMYVADFNNNRVQILDPRGQFKAMLDEGFRFFGPYALGCANGHLCVTDQADREGTSYRCRVYDLRSGDPAFARQLPPLAEADRGLVGKTGKVYISGRDDEARASGILVYTPNGDTAAFEEVGTEGKMGKFHHPRGMYLYPGADRNYAYFVNEFPFDVRRYKID
ncbi:MAG: hypothetical protein JXQ75_19515 [Phycisphaerae bacterium]|nr:hypothetical protein [Phycisphaerae bacterium]